MVPPHLKYTKTHLWCKVEDNIVTLGITEQGLKQLGTIHFLELPDIDDDVLTEVAIAEVETEEAAVELFSPVDGVVVQVHKALEDYPERIAADPYGKGWLVKIRLENPSQLEGLLSATQYEAFLAGKG